MDNGMLPCRTHCVFDSADSLLLQAIKYPTTFNALINSAGYYVYQLHSDTLKPIVNADVPIQCFVGTSDKMQPMSDAQPFFTYLKALNAEYNKTTLPGTHETMGQAPFQLDWLWEWLATPSCGGMITNNTSTSSTTSTNYTNAATAGTGTNGSSLSRSSQKSTSAQVDPLPSSNTFPAFSNETPHKASLYCLHLYLLLHWHPQTTCNLTPIWSSKEWQL